MPDTFPWSPLPAGGDILTSTLTLIMGYGIEDTSLVARLTTEGYKINNVKVLSLEAERGYALISLWRERTPITTKPTLINNKYAPVFGGAVQVRAFRCLKRIYGKRCK